MSKIKGSRQNPFAKACSSSGSNVASADWNQSHFGVVRDWLVSLQLCSSVSLAGAWEERSAWLPLGLMHLQPLISACFTQSSQSKRSPPSSRETSGFLGIPQLSPSTLWETSQRGLAHSERAQPLWQSLDLCPNSSSPKDQAKGFSLRSAPRGCFSGVALASQYS